VPGLVTTRGVETELGIFPNVEGRAPGERVTVMIRPDDVSFVPREDGEAVILRRDFRGSVSLYGLGLSSGRRIHSFQLSSATFPAGTRVRPEVQLLHVVTFPQR